MRLVIELFCVTLDGMKLFLAVHLILSSYVFADIQLPYQPKTDALCFENGDPDLAHVGIPILGSLGVKEGVCQGIAGVTAAFLENAQFEPSIEPIETADKIVHQLVENHRQGIRVKTIIPGSKNIREYCEKNKREFMRESILYNAEIATHQILQHVPLLFKLKKNVLRNRSDQNMLLAQLRTIEDTLSSGRYPLMLYYKHVVMVTAFSEKILETGRVVELSVYDSNHPNEIVIHLFELDMDGLPTLSNYLVWNIGN
jgi:hypothetical protein